MSTELAHPRTEYRLANGAPTGSWLGLGTPRLVASGTGLLLTAAGFGLRLPILVAGTPLLVALMFSFCFVGTRPLLGWVLPATAHAAGGLSGTRRQYAKFQRGPTSEQFGRLRLPAEFGQQLLSDTEGPLPIGVLDRPRDATRTVVFELAGVDRFPLMEPGDQDRLLTGWGRVLVGVGDPQTAVRCLQLVDHASRIPDRAQPTSTAADGGLSAVLAAAGSRRMSLLAVSFQRRAVERSADLVEACRRIAGQLLIAELAARPLSAGELLDRMGELLHPGRPVTRATTLLATSRNAGWEQVRVDDHWHRCYAVHVWPRSRVAANWMEPLLIAAPTQGARTFVAHLFPLTPQIAGRIARTARARAAVDRADRARLGLTASAAADRVADDSVAMDEELAAGHVGYRLTAVLSCAATNLPDLDVACRQMLDAAATTRLDCQPLHGQHAAALAATLPGGPIRSGGAW